MRKEKNTSKANCLHLPADTVCHHNVQSLIMPGQLLMQGPATIYIVCEPGADFFVNNQTFDPTLQLASQSALYRVYTSLSKGHSYPPYTVHMLTVNSSSAHK